MIPTYNGFVDSNNDYVVVNNDISFTMISFYYAYNDFIQRFDYLC